MKRLRFVVVTALVAGLAWGGMGLASQRTVAAVGQPAQTAELPTVYPELTRPPEVPPPIARKTPARVVVTLYAGEWSARLADGVMYTFWGYGRSPDEPSVPGPFIRVREGDTVEIRLRHGPFMGQGHEEEKQGQVVGQQPWYLDHTYHSIDLHAVKGPGGGAKLSQVKEGEELRFEWKALRPGLYIYHCASPHVPTHVANGMYGLILVEPKGGMPRVDREFYVVQGEFYTTGVSDSEGFQAYSLERARAEDPTYVVFNGAVGALTGDRALKAKAGETVRLYVGNGGPNLISSFHVIGEVFDRYYPEGTVLSEPVRNVQTVPVTAGGSAIVEFRPEVPGTYALVDHSLFRAIDKGALAEMVVEGPPRPDIIRPLGSQ